MMSIMILKNSTHKKTESDDRSEGFKHGYGSDASINIPIDIDLYPYYRKLFFKY